MYEILFQRGPVTIATFNILLAVSFIVTMIILVRFIQLKKMKLSFFVNHFLHFLIVPLITGRVFYFFEHFSLFKERLYEVFFIWDMGLSAFGVLAGIALTLYWLSRREQEDFWGWMDAFVLSGLMGLIFIHLGHFLKGSHYGRPTDLPWGIAFDTISIPFINPIHPTQLYSALLSFFIFSIAIRKIKRVHLTGVVGNLSVMVYSMGAFGIDFLHGSPSAYAKVIYALTGALAFIAYVHCSHRKLLEDVKK